MILVFCACVWIHPSLERAHPEIINGRSIGVGMCFGACWPSGSAGLDHLRVIDLHSSATSSIVFPTRSSIVIIILITVITAADTVVTVVIPVMGVMKMMADLVRIAMMERL